LGARGEARRQEPHSSALAVYYAALVNHTGKLASGEIGMVLILAATKQQASTVFNYCRGLLESSPVLSSLIDTATADEIRLKSGVIIGVHTASFRTVRGRTLLACIFDEVAFWRDETGANPDLEVYRAVIPALMTTNGMLIGISSPYRRRGLLHDRHRDYFGKDDDDVLVVQGSSTCSIRRWTKALSRGREKPTRKRPAPSGMPSLELISPRCLRMI
jgi:phage terminase large subunit-like protein